MKKNLMSVLILALVLVNTILTAILAIGIIPSVKKSNQLVETVASAINLANGESAASVPMAQIETYDLENEMTINFKKGEDGKDHYVVLKASISMDTKNKGYKSYGKEISTKASVIQNEINSVVSSYTYEEFRDGQQAVQDEILKNLRTMFDSDFIVSVGFSSVTCQ